MRTLLLFPLLATAAMSGCAGLPIPSTGRNPSLPPPMTARPPAAVIVDGPASARAGPVRPRVFVSQPGEEPFQLWILLAPEAMPCPVPDPHWPPGHPRICVPSVSIRPAAPVGAGTPGRQP